MISTEKTLEHTGNALQLEAREELERLFAQAPMAPADLLFNMGLYVRSGLLVKFLLMAELYKRFMYLPGAFVEFGSWFGQSLVLFENLRAILEPFNKQRRIISFDTFTGYEDSHLAGTGIYSTGLEYKAYLDKLLACHSRMNVYGHLPSGHELIDGDVCLKAPAYFADHPEMTIALAILDIGPYQPTKSALLSIKSHLVPGSGILLDEFTWKEMPDEARAFREVFGQTGYTIERLALYPSKTLVTIK